MSELNFIENLEAERTNLELHVDLCAQRYNQLIVKFEEVDQQLSELTNLCNDIRNNLVKNNSDTKDTYLKWAGVIIVILAGVIGHFLAR